MEGLIILVAVYVLEIVIKKMMARKNQPPDQSDEDEQQDTSEEAQGNEKPKRSLQDLIREFEEAQREASQGTYVPPTPPVEDIPPSSEDSDDRRYESDDEEEVELPVVTPSNPDQFTFEEIADSVIQWEEVSVDYLQQAFGFSEETAKKVLAELQAHHIAGRDMGDGFCDILVHDKVELANLFKRERREALEQEAEKARESELQARREAEAKHQKELADLEERARLARKQAGQINDGSEELGAPCTSSAEHVTHTRSFDKDEICRGFIWAKVIDEPRFKRRWNARVR